MASAATRGQKTTSRTSKSRKASRRLGYEQLESRRLLAQIVWGNRADFDTEFGSNTAAARAVIDQAIADWSSAIQSFNYRNVGQVGWAPTNAYTLNIFVRDLAPTNQLTSGQPQGVDGDGKPFSGVINIDDNANGGSWYFDPSPATDEEFTTPVGPFASAAGPNGTDFYTAVLHEIGHELGIFSGHVPALAFDSRITNNSFHFNDGTEVSLTLDNNHVWDSFIPNDLMTPTTPTQTRRVISELNTRMLGEAYGYTINSKPVHDRAFITSYDSISRQLTILGDLGTPFYGNTQTDDMNLDVRAESILVNVNGVRQTIPTTAVASILMSAEGGIDKINVDATPIGVPLTIVSGVLGTVSLGGSRGNLNDIQGSVIVLAGEDGGPSLELHDESNPSTRSFSISSTSVTFSGSNASVNYGGYLAPASGVRNLLLMGGSGGNSFTINNSSAYVSLVSGSSNDIVNVLGIGTQGAFIQGEAGVDRVTIGGDSVGGMQNILGDIWVLNSIGWTNLILNDAADKNRSDVILGADGSFLYEIAGLAPGRIGLSQEGIKSINVLASNAADGQGNLISVRQTPQNRAGDLAINVNTGKFNDTVYVSMLSSKLTIEGQDGIDEVFVGTFSSGDLLNGTIAIKNLAGRSALIVDTRAATLRASSTLWRNSFSRGNLKINFNADDLTLFKFLGVLGGTFIVDDTPQNSVLTAKTELVLGPNADSVIVRRTTSPLTINGAGGADRIVIGNNGKVDQIKGTIDIVNPLNSGRTNLVVSGENEVGSRTVEIDAGSVRGLAPADIRFNEQDLIGLTVSAGIAGNRFNVLNTPQNDRKNLSVTLNTGRSIDTVYVYATSSTTNINGQSGADVVNVGLAGNMQGVKNSLTVTNTLSQSIINLDNWADPLRRLVTMDVDTTGVLASVKGLSPGQILYRQSSVFNLNISGGTGNNNYTVRNTPLASGRTNLYAGKGSDTVQILGTTGKLNVFPEGNDNRIIIGAVAGAISGSLDRIRGSISLTGNPDVTGNRVEIIDSASAGQYTYTMDSQRISRNDLGSGSISMDTLPVSSLSLVAAGNGNQFQITSTPIHPASRLASPIKVVTGAGNDAVQIDGSTAPLNIDLGLGDGNTLRFGSDALTPDAIAGEVSVQALGNVAATLSDQASTSARTIKIDNSVAGQTLERRAVNALGQETLINKFKFNFGGQGRINYLAGRAPLGSNNFFEVAGVARNASVFVTGGPSLDLYQVGTGDTNKIAGSVTINSPDIDNDFASYNDSSAPVARRYLVTTNPVDATGITIERPGLSRASFNGLVQLNFLSPRVGGSRLDIQSTAAITLNLSVGNTDRVNLGSLSPTLGGTLSGVGPIALQSYNASDAVSILLDDSGNGTTSRNVTIEPYGDAGGIINSFGFPSMTFTDSANYSFDLRGGGADDSFLMRGRPLKSRFTIDGDAGDDILLGNGISTLGGGSGRDLLVAGTQGSSLNGGQGEDILIGGIVTDSTLANLNAIRAIWKGAGAYDARVSQLRGALLTNSNVAGNSKRDVLTGGTDALDLFFGELGNNLFPADSLVDRTGSETFIPLS